jgi:hypothetical protein
MTNGVASALAISVLGNTTQIEPWGRGAAGHKRTWRSTEPVEATVNPRTGLGCIGATAARYGW